VTESVALKSDTSVDD